MTKDPPNLGTPLHCAASKTKLSIRCLRIRDKVIESSCCGVASPISMRDRTIPPCAPDDSPVPIDPPGRLRDAAECSPLRGTIRESSQDLRHESRPRIAHGDRNHRARFLDSTPAAQSSRGASERLARPIVAHGDLSRFPFGSGEAVFFPGGDDVAVGKGARHFHPVGLAGDARSSGNAFHNVLLVERNGLQTPH